MDATEKAALKQLGERELWGADELPEWIDADLLRCLDAEGFVEARGCWWDRRDTSAAPSPNHGWWCSPMEFPGAVGDWQEFLRHRKRDDRNRPYELRVTERGRAELARMRRDIGTPIAPAAGKKKKKRKPSLVAQHRGLTKKEMQTMNVVRKHSHNFAAAARELGKDPSTVRENYERGLRKSERLLGNSRSVSLRNPLPVDGRGNEAVSHRGY